MQSTSSGPRATTGAGLRRELGLADATAIVVGIVIGSGIFLVPSDIARVLASPASAALAWIVGGALSLFGALSLAELNAAYPGAGGLYTFIRRAYGDRAGFLYTWAYFLLANTGSISALAVAFGLFAAALLPLGATGQKAVAVAVVLLLTGINCLGVRAGKWVQNGFTLAKLAGLAVLCAVIFSQRAPLAANAGRFWPQEWWPPAVFEFGVALVAVMWAFEGWAWVSFSGGEMRHPARDLPRALLFGTLILAAVYLTASSAYYSALTVQEVAGAERVAADAVTRLLGPAAGGAIAGLILVSIFGSINGSIMTSTRCYYQMAADGLFLPAFARLHPRTQVPIAAIVVQGLWGSLLAVLGTFQQLFTAVIFTSWISYAAAVAAVIVLRRTEPETPRPYRVPGYPWLPALFVVAALGIVASAVWSQPWHVGLAFALILSGLPVYRFLLGKKKGATDEH